MLLVLLVALGFVGIAAAAPITDDSAQLGKIIVNPLAKGPAVHNSSFAVPPNDGCPGASVIPDGPYPVLSSRTDDIPEATDPNDTGATCAPTEHGVWYQFTPSVTAPYQITTCTAGTTGVAPGPDTVLQVVSSSDGTCGGTFTGVACGDDGAGSGQCALGSIVTTTLTGGTTYWFEVFHYLETGADVNSVQLQVTRLQQHANDTCAGAAPLVLNTLTIGGINPLDTNNYQLTGNTCYIANSQQGNGVCTGGPTPGLTCTATANCGGGTGVCTYSTLTGRDVTYVFTAPTEDDYSFRTTHYDGGTNNAMMILSTCEPGPVVTTCIRAVNRNLPLAGTPFGAEEVKCLHLLAGQTVFPIVDNTANSATAISRFEIQVTRCVDEIEFNSNPAGADDPAGDGSDPPNAISRGCPVEGTIFQGLPGGDVDFFTLSSPVAGTRVFAQVDGNSAPAVTQGPTNTIGSSSSTAGVNFDLRVTTMTDTLEFDDANNNAEFAGFSPNIAGRELPGGSTYLRISMGTATAYAEPYRLYTTLRDPGTGPLGTSATPEPPDDPTDSNFPVGDYFYGNVENRTSYCTDGSGCDSDDDCDAGYTCDPVNGFCRSTVCTSDSDCLATEFCNDAFDTDFYGLCARQGEQIFVSLDADPTRDNTPLYSGLFLFTPSGARLYGIADLAAQGTTSNNTPSPGTLTGTTPFSPAQAINQLATETGLWTVWVNGQDPTGGVVGQLSSGDYLLSMATQCTAQEADLTITKTGDLVAVAGGNVNYVINVHNAGPAMGAAVFFHDTTPVGTTFVSMSVPDGWECVTPMVGATGDIDCFEVSGCMEIGDAQFSLTLNIPVCFGTQSITNTVDVSGGTGDPTPADNHSEADTLVTDPGTCDDGDSCTTGDTCVAGSCVGGPQMDCDDSNDCTDDSCVAGSCVSTNNSASCDDGNVCTSGDTCSGGSCQPGTPNNNPCDDSNACTTNDTCSGGSCVGGGGVDCNDGNVCTDDSCNPGTGCLNTCNNSCNTKGQGYWKRLCHGPHSGDFYTQKDVDCVNNSCTFADVQTVSQMCDELNAQGSDKCEKAEAKFMSLLLNVCRCRVQPGQSINSRCGPGSTVGEAMANSDATLCNPGRTQAECNHADCATFELINGEAFWANSLRLTRQGNSIRLTWDAPYANPDTLTPGGPKKYHVYRRVAGSTAPFVQIGTVNPNQSLTYLDTTASSGSWTYEVTSEY